MEELWDRIETWLRANAPDLANSLKPGATERQIDELEQALGMTLPEDVRESYLIHDGSRAFIEGWELLPLAEILEEWRMWKELTDNQEFEDLETEPELGVKCGWWNSGWVPLTRNGGGDSQCLDLDPTPSGNFGQIIQMWHDSPDRTRVAPTFEDWLREFADELEEGCYIDEGGWLARGGL